MSKKTTTPAEFPSFEDYLAEHNGQTSTTGDSEPLVNRYHRERREWQDSNAEPQPTEATPA